MSFYDIDLKTKIAGQHILWEIEKIIAFLYCPQLRSH